MGPQVQPKCSWHAKHMRNNWELRKRGYLIRFGHTEALLFKKKDIKWPFFPPCRNWPIWGMTRHLKAERSSTILSKSYCLPELVMVSTTSDILRAQCSVKQVSNGYQGSPQSPASAKKRISLSITSANKNTTSANKCKQVHHWGRRTTIWLFNIP